MSEYEPRIRCVFFVLIQYDEQDDQDMVAEDMVAEEKKEKRDKKQSTVSSSPDAHALPNPNPFTPMPPIVQQQQQQQKSTPTTTVDSPSSLYSGKKRATEWTQGDLDSVLLTGGGAELPDIGELKSFEPVGLNLGLELDAFFDAPSATPATVTQPMSGGMYHPIYGPQPQPQQQVSMSDRELLSLFRALEQRAKSVAMDSNSKLREAAVRFTQLLSASGQLGGWKHVEEFMTDQEVYERKIRKVEDNFARPSGSKSTPAPDPSSMHTDVDNNKKAPRGKIDELSDSSQALLKSAMIRAKWVLEIEKRNAGKLSDGKTLERVLAVLQKDQKWMQDCAVRLLTWFYLT
jgi:hypothetical protein